MNEKTFFVMVDESRGRRKQRTYTLVRPRFFADATERHQEDGRWYREDD